MQFGAGDNQRRYFAENPEWEFSPSDASRLMTFVCGLKVTCWAGKNLCPTSIVSRSDHLLEELLGNRAPPVRAHVPNLLLFRWPLVGWDTGRNKHAERNHPLPLVN
jgi:hypothetical protein